MFLDCSVSELTEKLVRIPSVTKDEEFICQTAVDWTRSTFPLAKITRERHNFWFSPDFQEGRPTIGLVGHLDTVPQAQVQDYGVREGKLYGLGACDMKGGVAVLLQALQYAQQSHFNLVAILYDREEGPYADNGLDFLLPTLPKMDFALVFEPTCNRIQAGCVGSLHANLSCMGKRAHSARPWQGENALYKAIPALQCLEQLGRKEVVVGGLSYFEVMTPTQMHTTSPTNAVPEDVRINVNYRFAPGKSVDQAWLDVQQTLGSFGPLTLLESAPAGDVALNSPALQAWIERNHLVIEAKQAWTDVARLTQAGIPAVNFGPGDPAQAHQANEHVEVAALEECLRLMKDLLVG
jgi:succinyl-diaminopimelate desuccinylase